MSLDKMSKDLGLVEKTIGSHRVEISLLPCKPAGDVFFQLMDIIGPSVGVALDKIRNIDYVDPEEDSSFGEIIGTLTSKLSTNEMSYIIDELLKDCCVDGERFDGNKHFRGEFSSYLKIIQFALEANFSDFFTGYLQDLGLEIPTWRDFMDMMKKLETQDTTVQTQEDPTPKADQ